MLAPTEGKNGSLESETFPLPRMKTIQTESSWVDAPAGCSQGRSFAEVLQSKPCSEVINRGSKGRSSHCMDLFPVSQCFEVGNGGIEQRLAVDCFELEKPSSLAAGSSKEMNGNSVKQWVKHLVGFFHSEMGRILTGLLEGFLAGIEGIPLRKKIRAVLKSLKGYKGFGFVFSPKPTWRPKHSCKGQMKVRTKPLHGRMVSLLASDSGGLARRVHRVGVYKGEEENRENWLPDRVQIGTGR